MNLNNHSVSPNCTRRKTYHIAKTNTGCGREENEEEVDGFRDTMTGDEAIAEGRA